MARFVFGLRNTTFSYALALSLISIPVNAFSQYETLCTKIEQTVSVQFNDSVLHRNDANSDGCDVEFTHPDLSITVQKVETRREVKKEFDSTVRLFRFVRINEPLNDFEKLNTYGTWNKAIFIAPKERGNSNVIVLRRKNYLITVLSQSREVILEVEGVLRSDGLISHF